MSMQAMSSPQDELARRLFSSARAYADSVGREFGDGAEEALRDITYNGAVELLGIEQASLRADRIQQAETDILRLVDLMLEAARSIDGYPADRLGEQTFGAAMLRFCPCRPFC